ncbi:MAG TPA: hypothetical protein VHD60_02500 [Candidatus Saccharimonadales bacterium]|nr:hypothetical protein [Candidatus Saccharimonadales bacterium]
MWPDIKIPNPLNALNPATYINDAFNWINGKIHGMFMNVATVIEQYLTNPPQLHAATLQDYLDGNAIGIANLLIFGVAICLLVIIMFKHQRLRSLPHLAITIVILAIADQSFFVFWDWLIVAGHNLAVAAQFYHPSNSGSHNVDASALLVDPGFSNVIAGIIGLLWLTFVGVSLTLIVVFAYGLIGEAVRFLILPAFVLRPLGERSQKFFDWLVSLGLVAVVFGMPVAIFCLELGKAATDNLVAGHTAIGSTFYLTAALLLGMFLQIVLVIATHSVWVNARTGQLFSTVRGRVESFSRRNRRADTQSVIAAHARTMQPIPVVVTQPRVKHRVARHVAANATEATTARVAASQTVANAHPAIGATVMVASLAANKYMRNRAQRAA